MLFVIHCLDHQGAYPRRLEHYDAHRAYVAGAPLKVMQAGPLLDATGNTRIGSLLIVEADSLQDVQAFSEGDPFRRLDVWATVQIHAYVVAVGNR
ncbi:YciI family protein [Pseudogulbenkiania sp. MAI-1]|uniref:YciI family protein n=1 Tax=Pseudogulbenkiania sp. MAI-1 TaxID=990370 RepID=UPI00045E936C|nr:YciI family protein [Pseudogulbenkiania sp. MAI-1]